MFGEYKGKLVVLEGKKVVLRRVKPKEIIKCVKWFKDKDVNRHLREDRSDMTEKKELAWLRKAKKSKNEFQMGIYYKEDGKEVYVGNTGLNKIDWKHGTTEFGIIIGDKRYWDRGIGTETLKLMVDFGFKVLKLNSIHLMVDERNKRAQRCYERVGFKYAGKLRNHSVAKGKLINWFVMDTIKKDWKG